MTSENVDQLCSELRPVLTPDEVAELLRVNRAVVYRWLESGYLPGSKLGKQWRILREDVRQLLLDGSNVERADLPEPHTKDNEGEA